jgi:phage baseplate assembly protein V
VVQLADDDKKLQLLQFGALAGETIDGAEHFQPYGFTSVPLAGAEVVAVFPNGDRGHPLVLAASDRNHRPTAGEAGQVTMYHYTGSKVIDARERRHRGAAGPGRRGADPRRGRDSRRS